MMTPRWIYRILGPHRSAVLMRLRGSGAQIAPVRDPWARVRRSALAVVTLALRIFRRVDAHLTRRAWVRGAPERDRITDALRSEHRRRWREAVAAMDREEEAELPAPRDDKD